MPFVLPEEYAAAVVHGVRGSEIHAYRFEFVGSHVFVGEEVDGRVFVDGAAEVFYRLGFVIARLF